MAGLKGMGKSSQCWDQRQCEKALVNARDGQVYCRKDTKNFGRAGQDEFARDEKRDDERFRALFRAKIRLKYDGQNLPKNQKN